MAGLGTALGFFTGIACIIGGVVVIVMALQHRMKRLEMQHRERLAMIERGLMPPPERDPAGFDAAHGLPRRQSRSTTLGIAVIAVGVGLMLIIGVAAGAPSVGVGLGGAVVVLGVAFVVIGKLQRGDQSPPLPPPSPAS